MFPEDAIHGFNYSRESIAAYLETVPDPGAVTWSPCSDPDRFQNTEALNLNTLNQHSRVGIIRIGFYFISFNLTVEIQKKKRFRNIRGMLSINVNLIFLLRSYAV